MNCRYTTFLGCAALAALAPVSTAQVRFRTVALSGEQAPGQPQGILLGFFGAPPQATSFNAAPVQIDAHGQVAFSAGLTGPGGSTPAATGAVLKEFGGHLQLVARHGDAAPGGGTFFMNALFNTTPGFAGGGCTFAAQSAATPEFGVYTDRTGTLQRSLFTLDHPPGTPAGATFAQVAFFMVRSGALIYDATYTDGATIPRTNEGLWRDSTGTLQAVAVNDMPAPGTAPGVVFTEGTSLAFFGPIDTWNASSQGRVIFNGYLGGPGITPLNDEGVWAEDASGLRLLIREGDPAPAAGPGARYLALNGFDTFGGFEVGLSGMALNDAGNAVFSAFLDIPGAQPENPTSLWARLSGSLVLVAREGLQAPGFPPGFTYLNNFPRLVINGGDRIAFSGAATDPAVTTITTAIWTGQGSDQVLLAREGDARPDGGIFGALALLQYSDSNVAVFIDLSDSSLYAADADGHSVRLIGAGDRYEAAPGEARVVRQVGPGLGIGDAGEFGMILEFTDLSQALVVATPFNACYANCDGSTTPPILNVSDFVCFQTEFAAGDPAANCDASTTPPILNVADFICFMQRFAAGCP
jgi:hypothetical protein